MVPQGRRHQFKFLSFYTFEAARSNTNFRLNMVNCFWLQVRGEDMDGRPGVVLK